MKVKCNCGLCNKEWNIENMFHESGLWFDSLCFFYLQNYRCDFEKSNLWEAIKAVKSMGGKYT